MSNTILKTENNLFNMPLGHRGNLNISRKVHILNGLINKKHPIEVLKDIKFDRNESMFLANHGIFYSKMKQEDIANLYGVSQQRVAAIIKNERLLFERACNSIGINKEDILY